MVSLPEPRMTAIKMCKRKISVGPLLLSSRYIYILFKGVKQLPNYRRNN